MKVLGVGEDVSGGVDSAVKVCCFVRVFKDFLVLVY